MKKLGQYEILIIVFFWVYTVIQDCLKELLKFGWKGSALIVLFGIIKTFNDNQP